MWLAESKATMSSVSRLSQRRRMRGITVFELGISLGFVGVVLGGVLLLVRPGLEADKTDAGMRDALRIREAAVEFRSDDSVKGCPTISQLVHDKKLESSARTDDPWGSGFRIECSSDDVIVRSAGKDGKLGTPDDIRVPHKRS